MSYMVCTITITSFVGNSDKSFVKQCDQYHCNIYEYPMPKAHDLESQSLVNLFSPKVLLYMIV